MSTKLPTGTSRFKPATNDIKRYNMTAQMVVWLTHDEAFRNLKITIIYLIIQDLSGIKNFQKESTYAGSTGQQEFA